MAARVMNRSGISSFIVAVLALCAGCGSDNSPTQPGASLD